MARKQLEIIFSLGARSDGSFSSTFQGAQKQIAEFQADRLDKSEDFEEARKEFLASIRRDDAAAKIKSAGRGSLTSADPQEYSVLF